MKKTFFLLTALALFLNVSAASFGVQRHPRVNSIPVSRSAVRDGVGMHRLASQMAASVDTKYDFSSSIADGWSSSATPQGYETTGSARGTQFASAATLTLKGVSNVTKVVVVCSANTDKNSISVSVGGTSIGSANLSKENNKTQTFTCSAASGDVVISISRSEKSVWIKSVTITGDAIELPDPSERLDPSYVYGSTVEILPQDSLGKVKIDTIVDNVLLSIPNGAFYSADIRAYAGSSLMLVAAKNIKAVAIDGSVKKNFSATTSSGTMTYLTDSEGASSGTPVLLIKDVNAKSVTIKVTAQLQCQKIVVYFDANPDVDIEGGEQGGGDDEGGDGDDQGGEGTYAFAEAYNYYDYLTDEGEDITLYLYNDAYSDAYAQLDLIVPNGTGTGSNVLPAGTYTIGESCAVNTALFGTYDEEYYPIGCWVFGEGEEDYWDLDEGTVVVAKSGSTYTITVNATCTYESKSFEFSYAGSLTVEEGEFDDDDDEGDEDDDDDQPADGISVAEAEQIAAALKDNEITTVTYTIQGYVGTLYDSGDFWLVAEAGGRSNLQVYKPTVDRALTKGDYVQVVGKLQKYVSKAGKQILEVVSATVTHIGDTPVPPTPVGTEISVAKAEEIAAALANNEKTAETYTVIGYAVKAYDPSSGTQDIWMSDTKGAKGNFMAKKTTSTDGTIFDDEYIAVTGKIEKNFYNDKTTLQIYKGSARHLSPTALMKLFPGVSVKKLMMQHKVLILHNGHFYDMNGKVIQ